MPYDNPTLQQQTQPGPPTHVQGGYSDHFILGSTLLQDYPHLLPTYFKNVGKKVPFLNKLMAMGFFKRNMQESDSPKTGHYEKPRTKNFFGISAIISGGGTTGQAIVVAILATDMLSVTDTFGTTSRFSRPRKFENYKFPDGNTYKVTNKDETQNPHQITLQPLKSTVNTNAGILVGAKCAWVNPQRGEGAKTIAPLKAQRFKYSNGFTILPEREVISGSNLTTGVSFNPVPGKPNTLCLEGIDDTEARFEEAKSNWFIWGETSDQITDFSDILNETVPMIGSECLIPYIKASGYTINFGDVDSYDIDDAFAVSNYYHDLAVGATSIIQLQGRNLANRKDVFLKDLQDNTNISYSTTSSYMKEGMRQAKLIDPNFNSEGMFFALDFRGYRIGGLNFIATGMAEFDDTYGFGQLGWKDVQINVPLGTFQSEDKTMVPYIGLEWRGKDGYSRMNEVWSTSGAGRISSISQFTKCLEDDGYNMFLRAELAPHFGNGIQMVIEKPTTMVI
jgi:hypothetical protein